MSTSAAYHEPSKPTSRPQSSTRVPGTKGTVAATPTSPSAPATVPAAAGRGVLGKDDEGFDGRATPSADSDGGVASAALAIADGDFAGARGQKREWACMA